MLFGIDVSGWQPATITRTVSCDFAIVKATEGTQRMVKCAAQISGARATGKAVGAYHFAAGGDSAAEAAAFLSAIHEHLADGLLLALDWEGTAVQRGPGWALAWLNAVHDATGVKPLIYMNTTTLHGWNWADVVAADYGLWLASWPTAAPSTLTLPKTPAPSAGPWPFIAIWQYTAHGLLPGHNGELDLNVFLGDRTAWSNYCTPTAAPAPPKPTPPAGGEVVVQEGDTLDGIARAHGTTWPVLQRLNHLADPNLITPGQRIQLP